MKGFRASPVCPSGKGNMYMKTSTQHWWNDTDGGKPMYSEKTCPTATLSTTNVTWTNLKSNLGLRGEKSVTNPLQNKSALYI
jgi:hypothetical protein